MARRQVGDWKNLHCGDTVCLIEDERHEGRVEGIESGYYVSVKWDNGWYSTVALHELRRLNSRLIRSQTKTPA